MVQSAESSNRLTRQACHLHYEFVIRSTKGRGLSRLYHFGDRSGVRSDLVETVVRILSVLDTAAAPQDLNIPRYRLHPLKGDRRGFWAVTVRANWRIVFRFEDGVPCDVELVDYH
jgi:proteic killer suppression protein